MHLRYSNYYLITRFSLSKKIHIWQQSLHIGRYIVSHLNLYFDSPEPPDPCPDLIFLSVIIKLKTVESNTPQKEFPSE